MDDLLAVNLKSALWGMQVAARHMQSRPGGGHIINVSSFLAKVPAASVRSIYSASKAALNHLTSNARMDLAGTGIAVTTVMPGLVTTDFAAVAATNTGSFSTTRAIRPPAGYVSQTPAECAAVIAGVVHSSASGTAGSASIPVEVYTQGEAQRQAALKYAQDVATWEAEATSGRTNLPDDVRSP